MGSRHLLIAILGGQILLESLFCFISDEQIFASAYYVLMRFIHVGFLPSLFFFIVSKDKYIKVLSLTLLIQCAFRLILEMIATNDNYKHMALTVTNYDYYNFFLLASSIFLSLLNYGLLNRLYHFVRNSLPLSRQNKRDKKNN